MSYTAEKCPNCGAMSVIEFTCSRCGHFDNDALNKARERIAQFMSNLEAGAADNNKFADVLDRADRKLSGLGLPGEIKKMRDGAIYVVDRRGCWRRADKL